MPPINAVLSPDGNTITLHSPENCDRAFVTISGNGTYLTEMVNFTDQTATLDVSDLDCGVYLITVEYENGTIYIVRGSPIAMDSIHCIVSVK